MAALVAPLARGGPAGATLPLTDIRARDPFILAHKGTYYLYVQMANRAGRERARGVEVYRSKDLSAWDGPSAVFELPPDFWAREALSAPEVHFHRGKFYLCATFSSNDSLGERAGRKIERRGTQILWAKSPMGPFHPFANRAHTPADWASTDGTLWVEDGTPYLVFCRDWTQIEDGTVELLRLQRDLSGPAGNPKMLFHATDGPWVQKLEMDEGRLSGFAAEGPFLHRTSKGRLFMIWSSFGTDQRAIGVAESQWGSVEGPWIQRPDPLFRGDGGHGMLFRTFEGRLKLAVHRPNRVPLERARIFDVDDAGESLRLTEGVET